MATTLATAPLPSLPDSDAMTVGTEKTVAYLRDLQRKKIPVGNVAHMDTLLEDNCVHGDAFPLTTLVDQAIRNHNTIFARMDPYVDGLTTEGHATFTLQDRRFPSDPALAGCDVPTLNVVKLAIRPSLRNQGRADALLSYASQQMVTKFGTVSAVRVESILEPRWAAHLVASGWVCETDPEACAGLVSVFRKGADSHANPVE